MSRGSWFLAFRDRLVNSRQISEMEFLLAVTLDRGLLSTAALQAVFLAARCSLLSLNLISFGGLEGREGSSYTLLSFCELAS